MDELLVDWGDGYIHHFSNATNIDKVRFCLDKDATGGAPEAIKGTISYVVLGY